MNRKMILDRIPRQFCEGPFWGNGKMGAVLYVRDNKLCICIDHVGLWELRETLPDEPKATFTQILQHQKEYLAGDTRYVEDTNIFEEHIGRTKLPALAIELELAGEITGFCAQTDMGTAQSMVRLTIDREKEAEFRIGLDSCVNVLNLELSGSCGREVKVNARGWDLESARLRTLKNWNYESCRQSTNQDSYTIRQDFGGSMTAVLCGRRQQTADGISLAVTIAVDAKELEAKTVDEGNALVQDYLSRKEKYQKAHEKDWQKYWNKFGITVPNERLQEAFDQEMYKLYCNEREDSAPVTLQGVWNPDNRMPAWFGDLHNDLNVQSCYWPAYKTGNVALVRPYIDYYTKAMPRLEERAWKLFGIKKAIHIPTMMAPDGTGAASEWCYWNTILGPELFVSVDFTWFYEYSKETDTLRDKIYPFIEKVIHLYEGIAYEKEDDYLHIPFTTSPEVDRDGHMLMADDATFTLSCLHYLCRKMAEYAKILGKEGSRFLEWEKKLMPAVPNEKGFPVFDEIDVFESHRHFCQMFPIYPLGQEAHNETANRSLDTAVNQGFLKYAAFSFPYMGIMAARCGRGNMCRTMLEIYCMVFRSRNSFTVNGDPYQNGVLRIADTNAGESADAFTLESGFFIPTALCEMFVHRSRDTVWLAMGIPDEWKDCSCHGLAVEGGHHIDIERKDYKISSVIIYAAYEEQLAVCWKNEYKINKLYRNNAEICLKEKSSCSIYVQPGEQWRLKFE